MEIAPTLNLLISSPFSCPMHFVIVNTLKLFLLPIDFCASANKQIKLFCKGSKMSTVSSSYIALFVLLFEWYVLSFV